MGHAGGVSRYDADGTELWAVSTAAPAGQFAGFAGRYGPDTVELVDLDGDSDLDLVFEGGGVGIDGVRLFINDGRGRFVEETATRWPAGIVPSYIRVSDIDEDGDNDVVVGHSDWVEVFFNDGSGVFPDDLALTGLTGGAVYGLEIADVDGDDNLDILATSSGDQGAMVFLGDGLGGFPDTASIATGASPAV